ncbi:unnamed protein product, partial [Prunus brigantina]
NKVSEKIGQVGGNSSTQILDKIIGCYYCATCHLYLLNPISHQSSISSLSFHFSDFTKHILLSMSYTRRLLER